MASPFWPKFYETRGLAPEQIGLILAASTLIRLPVGPLAGRLADLLDRRRLMLAACAVAAAGAAAAFLLTDGFWLFLAIALVQAVALAPTTSLADALAGRRHDYGWVRGSASAAFVVGTLAVGQLISGSDLHPVVWMNVALLLAAAAATAQVPPGIAEAAPAETSGTAGVRGLLGLPRFRIVIAVAALIYGSHAMHDGFAVIRWSAAGLDASTISVLWSEAVAAEVVVFFLLGPWLLGRIGAHGAAVLAALAGIVRWSVAGVTTSVAALALVQPLHGLTFALLHLSCMRIMAAIVPLPLSATAQALYALGSGIVSAVLTAASGTLYAAYGGLAFFAMAALCVVALPFAWYGLSPEPPAR